MPSGTHTKLFHVIRGIVSWVLPSDEINVLISELRSRYIRTSEKLTDYLTEKKLPFDYAIKLLNGMLDYDFQEYIGMIYPWLQKNLKILIENYSQEFITITETISKKDPTYVTGLLLSLQDRDLDVNYLININRMTSNSQEQELQISSGLILGEIGIVQPKLLLDEFRTIFNQPDDLKEIAFLKAILVSSNKYRKANFILTNDIKSEIIKCTKSSNTRLASEAIKLCVVLFERDSRFRGVLQEYFNQSSEHKREIYQHIIYNDLKDIEFELTLLRTSLNSNVHDEMALAQWVIETKLLRSSRPNNNGKLDKKVLQKFALDYLQELCKRKDMSLSLLSEELLTQIGDANIAIAFDYLLRWIGTDTSDEQTNAFLYPNVVSYIFKNHEKELFEFLQTLAKKDANKFDILVYRTINEIVDEAKRKFRSELHIHNNSTIRELKKLINDDKKLSEIKPIESKDLDTYADALSRYIEILSEQHASDTSIDYDTISHMVSNLKTRRQVLIRKYGLLINVLNLLISMCQKYDINYERITENFQGHKIDSVVMRCQILTKELLTTNRQEKINYDDIEGKLLSFPNIEKLLGHKWLKEKCLEGHPYHLVVLWLSRLMDRNQMNQLILDYRAENDYVNLEKLERALRPLVWLRHVDTCLGYFTKENDKGKKAIISHLKDRRHFLQTLSQLEIGLKLKQSGYKVDLEDRSIDPQIPIDIIASKDDLTIIFELATFDMYSHLKYTNFASEIPDRAESTTLQKIEQVSKYVNKTSDPIILIFNLTHAPDVDLHGIQYSFQGSEVEHIVMDRKSHAEIRFTKIERNPAFVSHPKANLVSALISYKNEIQGIEMKRVGGCLLNLSADKKLDENTLNDLKSALFE